MKLHYMFILFLVFSPVAFAQNVTNQTNQTEEEVDQIQEAKTMLEKSYDNYKQMFESFSNATGIEPEMISGILMMALVFFLLGKRARKYLFFLMALFIVLLGVGWIGKS